MKMKTCKLKGCEKSIEHRTNNTKYCSPAHWRHDRYHPNDPDYQPHNFYGHARGASIADEEKETIINLRENGYTYRDIIAKTGRCRSSVRNILHEAGLTKPRHNPKKIAIKAEDFVKEYFENLGLRVERQDYAAPFDLLVNGLEVDVKSSSSTIRHAYQFVIHAGSGGISKLRPPKDFYACIATDTGDIWIIPSEKVKVKCITITHGGKYDDYLFAYEGLR